MLRIRINLTTGDPQEMVFRTADIFIDIVNQGTKFNRKSFSLEIWMRNRKKKNLNSPHLFDH